METKLGRWFGRWRRDADGAAEESQDAPPEDWTRRLDGFSQTTGDLLASEDRAFGESVHALSFAAYREVVGDRWESLGPRVRMLCEGILQTRLKPPDLWAQVAEDAFVMAFPRLKSGPAGALARDITAEIGGRLMGEHFKAGDRPLVHTAEVAVDQAVGADGAFRLDVLVGAVAEARAEEVAGGEEADGGRRSATAAAVARAGGVVEGGNAVQVRWRPVWDRATESVVGYRCVPSREYEGRRVSDLAFHPRGAGAEFLAALDADVLALAAAALPKAVETGAELVVPIHAASAAPRRFVKLAAILTDLPPHLSRDLLVIEVVGGISAEEMDAAVAGLRPHCGAIAARLGLGGGDPHDLLAAGASRVGAYWAEAVLRRRLHDAARAGGRALTYLWNVPDRKALAASVGEGVTRFEGPAVAAVSMSVPGKTGRLPLDKLLPKL